MSFKRLPYMAERSFKCIIVVVKKRLTSSLSKLRLMPASMVGSYQTRNTFYLHNEEYQHHLSITFLLTERAA